MSDTAQNTGWRGTLARSAALLDKSKDERVKAGRLLWDGAQNAIAEWLPNASSDIQAENLRAEVMDALGGTSRKGDASKIVTVALATKNNGLILAAWPNLAKAYAEAKRLTTTAQTEAAEDKAVEAAVAALAESAPKSASTPENAAKIVMAEGPAKAAALLLDALGATDNASHRAFIRAITQEAASRIVKPTKAKTNSGPKAGATAAKKAAPATAKKAAAPSSAKKAATPATAKKAATAPTAPTAAKKAAAPATAKKAAAPAGARPAPVQAARPTPVQAPSAASQAAAGRPVPVSA